NLSYNLAYKYLDPATNKYVVVKEAAPSQLREGWNLLTRTVLGQTRTLLVFGDVTPPTFELSTNVPSVVNQADIDNGASFVIQGTIVDNSFGRRSFYTSVRLNDARSVTLNADGTLTIAFTIKDLAGNTTVVTLTLQVSRTATLVKDLGRINLPTIEASATL